MQSYCVEFSPLGSMQSPKNHASGEFSPNTVRLTACRAGNSVADSEKSYLNFLFAPAGTPQSVLETLNREVGLITSDIQFRDAMRQRTFALRTYSLQVMHDVTVKQRLMNESLIKKARIKLE